MAYLFFQKMKSLLHHYWREILIIIMLGMTLILSCAYLFRQNENDEVIVPVSESTQFPQSTLTAENPTTISQECYVDVKGAVQKPGVYVMKEGDRIQDVIQRAKGFKDEADLTQINLAQKISDQMVIIVPQKGETLSSVSQQSSASMSATSGSQQQIHLNSATVEELQHLNGIGQKKAESIIQYRQEHGGFQSIEELRQVKGIGSKLFDKIKENVMVP